MKFINYFEKLAAFLSAIISICCFITGNTNLGDFFKGKVGAIALAVSSWAPKLWIVILAVIILVHLCTRIKSSSQHLPEGYIHNCVHELIHYRPITVVLSVNLVSLMMKKVIH